MLKVINPKRLLSAISMCLDFAGDEVDRNRQAVAFVGFSLKEELGFPEEDNDHLITASVVCDSGVDSSHVKASLLSFGVEDSDRHCESGFEMLKRAGFFTRVADGPLLRNNHFSTDVTFARTGFNPLPIAQMAYMGDGVKLYRGNRLCMLDTRDAISRKMEELGGQIFDPHFIQTLLDLSCKENLWSTLAPPFLLLESGLYCPASMDGVMDDDLKQVAEIFARIVDQKSSFTHRHSRGVAAVARRLAEFMGFTPEDASLMEVAGLLHDLGKLSIPDEILEKPEPLTKDEYAMIRQHTYYTLRILNEAGVPSPIPEWAAFHHEKLDGTGYPFQLEAGQLPLGSRIMAVADVYTALREDRPYRPGMDRRQIETIMRGMVSEKALHGGAVNVLFDSYTELDDLFGWISSQENGVTRQPAAPCNTHHKIIANGAVAVSPADPCISFQ